MVDQPIEPTVELDTARLARWMDANGVPGNGTLPTARRLTGGSQNELLLIDRGGEAMVLRRPIPGAPAERIDGIRREHRLVRALRDTDVPHARLIAGCDDEDVIGTPFYVMEVVDGWSPAEEQKWPPPFDTDLGARAGLALELVDGAARLARVDWRAQDLEGFGRPENFHDRQVDRWLSFLGGYRFRELPGLDEAAAWLRANRPKVYEPGIMHGDYQFANVMYGHGAPARLAAIIDWEMTTIGDPLLDLGWVLISWSPEGDDMTRYIDMEGMPTREVMLERYEAVSGRPTDDIDYYVILAKWKLAVVLEQGFQRAGDDEKLLAFGPVVLKLFENAAALAESTDYR